MNVDIIANGQASGEVAGALMNNGSLNVGMMKPFLHTNKKGETHAYVSIFKGGDPKKPENYSTQMVNNATLRRDEWKRLDDALLGISEKRLGGVQDLIDMGLTYEIGNGMGSTVLEWHDVSDALEAVATMDGANRGQNDRVAYQYNYLPLPIIHVDYEINARVLAASRNLGQPLDTTMVERAGRKVNEFIENSLFTNTQYAYGELDERSRNSIYSYTNHPDRNTYTLANGAWTGTTAANILADVIAMKQKSIDAFHYGPWKLYIPTAYETVMDEDYDSTTATGRTIRERILQIDGITGVKVVDTLPANNVVLVQMTSDVVRLVRGMALQNVQWGVEGNMLTKYKVMTIQVPQIRSDQAGKSGVVHGSV